MARTFCQWRDLVRTNTTRLTADQIERTAQACFDGEAAGRPIGVWHAAAAVAGNLANCPCHPCTMSRRLAVGLAKRLGCQ